MVYKRGEFQACILHIKISKVSVFMFESCKLIDDYTMCTNHKTFRLEIKIK
jgi:hypothetical protein